MNSLTILSFVAIIGLAIAQQNGYGYQAPAPTTPPRRPPPSNIYNQPQPSRPQPARPPPSRPQPPRPQPPRPQPSRPSNSYGSPSNQGPVRRPVAPKPSSNEPQMPYDFDWGVNDQESGNSYSHTETNDGQTTQGEYRVLLPDGRTQVVKFFDDGNGYNAEVTYE